MSTTTSVTSVTTTWTRVDAVRRLLALSGPILGALMLVAAGVLNLGPAGDSMRASFEAMAARSGQILVADVLETLGFLFVLASFAALAGVLRRRGAMVATWGAPLCLLGIAGFAMSNATGLGIVGLAQLPDQDAAFATALAAFQGGTGTATGMVETLLEVLGQVGLVLVTVGLVRARVVGWWAVLALAVGMVLDVALGSATGTLVADVLLLVVSAGVVGGLTRAGRGTWLGAERQEAPAAS